MKHEPDLPDLMAELDAAEDVVMGRDTPRAEIARLRDHIDTDHGIMVQLGRIADAAVFTEWGVRYGNNPERYRILGEEEDLARLLASDYAKAGQDGTVVRRTVTYGPWEEVPDERG